MLPLVSYILPYYNGQDTIIGCLNSICSIDLPEKEWEAIIVDDHSPNPAENCLKDYLLFHPNIRIVRHEVNKRPGGAKNTGILLAKGEYIVFADQDDVIVPEFTKKALYIAKARDVDMLACHYYVQKGVNMYDEGIDSGDGFIMSGREFCEHYFRTSHNLAPWANLYKREYLMKIAHPFEENVLMEDSDWVAWHWIHANKVGIFNHPIYTWKMNPSSITHSQHYLHRADWVKFGYCKMRDAKLYNQLSSTFASIMMQDGQWNIEGGMKKVWKVDNYRQFYRQLGRTLLDLQEMEWRGMVKLLICYPRISLCLLYLFGSPLKYLYYARHKIVK